MGSIIRVKKNKDYFVASNEPFRSSGGRTEAGGDSGDMMGELMLDKMEYEEYWNNITVHFYDPLKCNIYHTRGGARNLLVRLAMCTFCDVAICTR